MEFQPITEFFPWSEDSLLTGSFICASDVNSGSNDFAFSCLLLKLLRDKIPVKIISCNHGRNHFELLLQKNAMDVRKMESDGRLEIIALICESNSSTYFHLREAPGIQEGVVELQMVSDEQAGQTTGGVDWTMLQQRLFLVSTPPLPPSEVCAASPYALLIDDLDALQCLAPSAREARSFIIRCLDSLLLRNEQNCSDGISFHCVVVYGRDSGRITGGNIGGVGSTRSYLPASCLYAAPLPLGWMGMDSGGDSWEEDEPPLSDYCRYRADVNIEVHPLYSGYSSEAHGVLHVGLSSRLWAQRSSQTTLLPSLGCGGAVGGGGSGSSRAFVPPAGMSLTYRALDSGIRCVRR